MDTAKLPSVLYYRNTRYLPDAEPMFAIARKGSAFPAGTEFRLDGDHWTQLEGQPVGDRLFNLDPFLDYVLEKDMPLPLTPETVV